MPPAAPPSARAAAPRALDARAAEIFAGACGACHAPDAPMTRDGAPSLALSTTVNGPSARNVVDIILNGLPMREGRAGPYMPGFGASLTDAQVAALAAYVRARFADGPAWTDIDAAVREARKTGGGT
jgi:mono/diheme cytochrome c family protein